LSIGTPWYFAEAENVAIFIRECPLLAELLVHCRCRLQRLIIHTLGQIVDFECLKKLLWDLDGIGPVGCISNGNNDQVRHFFSMLKQILVYLYQQEH
jgi:hypothetical protein